jgi:hypothetical protein
VTRSFEDSGLTIGQILGKSIATNSCLAGFAPDTLERYRVPQSFLNTSGLFLLRQLGAQIEEAHREAARAKSHWKLTRLLHPERFTVEEACDLAARASIAFTSLGEARDRLMDVCVAADATKAELAKLDLAFDQVQRHIESHPRQLLLNLLDSNNVRAAQRFVERCEVCRGRRSELSRVLAGEPGAECLDLIRQAQEICNRFELTSLDLENLTEQLQELRQFLETARAISSVLRPLVDARPESSAWDLSDIAKAHALVKESGRDAVLCRNARASEPDATHVLFRLCGEGRQLQAQKAELARKVSFAVEVSVEALSECASTLRVAGTFRIFSRRYHNAKRLFLSLARMDKYDKRQTIRTLEALITYRRKEGEFTNHPHTSAMFGFRLKGTETEFGPFERLAKFYESAGAHFGHPQKKTLRAFLLEAAVTELDLLPPIPAIGVVITYDSLQKRIQAAEAQIRTLEASIAALQSCVHVFADPNSVEPVTLPRLLEVVRSLVDEEAALDRCEEAKNIFGSAFAGSRTASQTLTAAVAWASDAQGLKQVLLPVLSADRASEARDRIGEVLSAEMHAKELLSRVVSVAKIDVAHFAKGSSYREIATQLADAAQDQDGLFSHALFATILDQVRPHGLLPLIEDRLQKDEHLQGLGGHLEAVAVRQLAKAVFASSGSDLAKYHGSKLDQLRKSLAEQDREITTCFRQRAEATVCRPACCLLAF